MLLDKSVNNQNYIEYCEVCCNPIQVTAQFLDFELTRFVANNIEQ